MTTKVTIDRINLINGSVKIMIKENIDGYVVENNVKKEAQVSDFSIDLKPFTAMVCDIDDDIADYRNSRETPFDQRCLALLFRGAKLTIERTPYAAGEEIINFDGSKPIDEAGNVRVHKNDGYNTTIKEVKLSETGQKRLDGALTL